MDSSDSVQAVPFNIGMILAENEGKKLAYKIAKGEDILAEKDGITYAVQCKCYDKPIGVKAVQEVYAGRDYYGKMVGVVMTNQYFTQPAMELASKLKIILWDRDQLKKLAEPMLKNNYGQYLLSLAEEK